MADGRGRGWLWFIFGLIVGAAVVVGMWLHSKSPQFVPGPPSTGSSTQGPLVCPSTSTTVVINIIDPPNASGYGVDSPIVWLCGGDSIQWQWPSTSTTTLPFTVDLRNNAERPLQQTVYSSTGTAVKALSNSSLPGAMQKGYEAFRYTISVTESDGSTHEYDPGFIMVK